MIAHKLLPLALVLGLSPAALGQDWSLSLGRRTDRGHVSLTLGSGGAGISVTSRHGRRPVYGPVCAPEPRGHYETITEKVWVPGCSEQVWVPARYEVWVDHCGVEHRRLLEAGHYRTVQHPGHYELQTRRVWVPAPVPRRGYGSVGYGSVVRYRR